VCKKFVNFSLPSLINYRLDNSNNRELTQHINLRIQILKQRTLVDKIREDQTNELSDNEIIQNFYTNQKLTDKEYESDRAFIFKEIGIENLNMNFSKFKARKERIEIERKSIYENSENYEICLQKLIELTKTNIVQKPRPYNEMPLFKTIKRLGEGDFGSAYLIVKKDIRKKFQLEDEVNYEELYVLKYQTFADEDKYSQYPDSYARDITKKINLMLKSALKSEIGASFLLSHPNITKFYGSYSTNYFCTFVHEYVCCGVIKHLLSSKEDIVLNKRIKFVTAQLVMALEYLHEIRLVHGDIHQGNVCTDYRGYVKLIDFGMCSTFDESINEDRSICNNKKFKFIRMKLFFCFYLFLVSFIATCHLDHLRSPFTNEKLKIRPNERIKTILENIDNPTYRYAVDTMAISKIFFTNYKQMKEMQEVKDMFFFCAGLKEDDLLNVYQFPKMKQLRKNKYYNEIDFRKLFLREYDLEKILEIDCEKMFESYSRFDYKIAKHEADKYKYVFPADTKYSYLRKNDPNYINQNYEDFGSSFKDLI
jgi:serine/threonine protein kinase